MEIPLPATLPPQSAAMAAYLNAANHLFMTNPLAAARRLLTPNATEDTALDFSAKTEASRHAPAGSDEEEEEDDDDDEEEFAGVENSDTAADLSAPLDLSYSGRKRQNVEQQQCAEDLPTRKMPRITDYKSWITPSINPYLAAVAAASLSPKMSSTFAGDWKKPVTSPNEASKALERMTEMTRLGATEKVETTLAKQANNTTTNASSAQTNGNGRHSAWQSHWLNKGAHSVKDVFKCVWCKQSFPTLASLTTHMKETKHCGVNVPPSSVAQTQVATTVSTTNTNTTSTICNNNNNNHNNNNNNNNNCKKSDLNLLIKETMPLPRKLVRGQDVWLGKGAEQTRQILKCMWCGQSFRSLAEMTAHMQETQHYTNIISQEQIISWKSSDEKSVANGSGATSPNANNALSTAVAAAVGANANANTVSAVLTCKVCDQAFPSLKELSNHMVKNSHYKEPIIHQSSESSGLGVCRRGRQTLEKRKKSLPVRKLLEMERAGQDFSKTSNALDPALKPLRDFAASTKITCEKCGDKIETALFVEHIRQCLGGMLLDTPRNAQHPAKSMVYSPLLASDSISRKTNDDRHLSPISSTQSDILTPSKDTDKSSNTLPSVLNAIEQLIEKSFDIRPPRQNSGGGGGGVYASGSGAVNTPLGASILKRLGIDDTIDYTKPLMDAHSLRYRSSSTYSIRDRSASESSSISERCSSLLEAATPERQLDYSRQATPRLLTPEKLKNEATSEKESSAMSELHIKTEPTADIAGKTLPISEKTFAQKITVKKEFNECSKTDAESKPTNCTEEHPATPHSRAVSPSASASASERSSTPKSTVSDKKLSPTTGSSLTALSSMFDSLNNMNVSSSMLSFTSETNNNNNNNLQTNNNNFKGVGNLKKTSANPLAALQKLCDTTDPPAANTRSTNNTNNSTTTTTNVTATTTAGMIAYGWDTDAMMKCAYCDTTFYTKGAYRHHLNKVHFIREDSVGLESQKSPVGIRQSPKSSLTSPSSVASKSPAATRQELSPSMVLPNNNNNVNSLPTINPYEESPQSKFRKYTELAKQLSSKNN